MQLNDVPAIAVCFNTSMKVQIGINLATNKQGNYNE